MFQTQSLKGQQNTSHLHVQTLVPAYHHQCSALSSRSAALRSQHRANSAATVLTSDRHSTLVHHSATQSNENLLGLAASLKYRHGAGVQAGRQFNMTTQVPLTPAYSAPSVRSTPLPRPPSCQGVNHRTSRILCSSWSQTRDQAVGHWREVSIPTSIFVVSACTFLEQSPCRAHTLALKPSTWFGSSLKQLSVSLRCERSIFRRWVVS